MGHPYGLEAWYLSNGRYALVEGVLGVFRFLPPEASEV